MNISTKAESEIYFSTGRCSLGSILVAQSGKGVCAVLLGDNSRDLELDLQKRFSVAVLTKAGAELRSLVSQVIELVESPEVKGHFPLDLRGTEFQKRVWQALRRIPIGSVASYTEIASRIGSPKAFRAVARACAANSLAVVIPCHRVVKNNGALSGYRWGLSRKRALLEREAAQRK